MTNPVKNYPDAPLGRQVRGFEETHSVADVLRDEFFRDWPEDFEHENGNYTSRCIGCKETFRGHKRRILCKLCENTELDSALVE